ncbi:TPA: DUF1642 domain-containing protein [Streptococcus suis]|nr:DUF1642 domain-containing protein [Streptococcus suis]
MKQNDFYEVNGCTEFIPVTINETFADGVGVTVHSATHPFRMMVKQVYRFLKQHEPQKVVVPQVAVDYYERYKDQLTGFDEWFGDFYDGGFLAEFPQGEKLAEWLYDNDGDTNRQRELALATLIVNGPGAVEVEQEKLYTVEIAEAILTKITRGSNVQYKMLPFGNVSDVFDKAIYTTRLTEQEIKQQDERLWQWAKEVE